MQKISVTILTLNEEALIERAISSVSWADEIVVLDSMSKDKTREIARALGAKVYEQPWLGWIAQHEKAVALSSHDWILTIDADEIVTHPLSESIRRVLASDPDPRSGFVLDRREEFLGTILPNMRRKQKRDTFIRMFNRREGGWDPKVPIHEEVRVPGDAVPLSGALLHWRNHSISQQLEVFNRNADTEAMQILASQPNALVLRTMFKPPLRFLWLYLRCGFWRLGPKGLICALLIATFEFLRHAKAWEAQVTRPLPHPPNSIYPGEDSNARVGVSRTVQP